MHRSALGCTKEENLACLWKTWDIQVKPKPQAHHHWVRRKQVKPLKPATDSSDAGVIETTTRRRVIPATDISQETKTPDLWEYLRAIPAQDWARHMIYLYRSEPAPSVPLLKCADQYFAMPNGQRVPVADEQEVEFALAHNYGGGVFRLIVKKGAQWITQGRIPINAPIRPITIPVENQNGPNQSPSATNGTDSTAMIAGKAIDTIAGQEHAAVNIGIGALNAAANVVRSFADGRPQGGGQDDLTRQFMQVIIARAMEDPFEKFMKFFTLMRELNPTGGVAGAGGPLVDKLLGAAVERFMNPVPAGPPVSVGAEILRQAPSLIAGFAEVMREQRMAAEAQANALAAQRGVPQTIPAALPPVPPLPPVPTPVNGKPTMEFIEQKIIEIFREPNLSADQAAETVMAFLEALDPNAVGQLASLGEGGLVTLFQTRPILKQACNNMPRLVEFIRAFLRMHAEDKQADAEAEATKQPLPN